MLHKLQQPRQKENVEQNQYLMTWHNLKPSKSSSISPPGALQEVMPHVIVFTPHTRVFTRLRQSDTWKVCLSSLSAGRSKGAAGGGAGVTGVGGAGGGRAGVVTVGVAGTPGNAPGSTTPISDWGLHFLKIDTSWYRAMVWNFNTKTWE